MLGQFAYDGTPISGYAFGINLCDAGNVRGSAAPDYPFQIALHGEQLCLTVDVYTAFYLPADPDDFNVDLWEDLKQNYFAPACREGFYALSHTARTLLAGDTIKVLGGQVRCIAAAMSAAGERGRVKP